MLQVIVCYSPVKIPVVQLIAGNKGSEYMQHPNVSTPYPLKITKQTQNVTKETHDLKYFKNTLERKSFLIPVLNIWR